MTQVTYPSLFEIPKELITYELCEAAVKKNGLELRLVPEQFPTPNLCSLAIKNTKLAIFCVPKEFVGRSGNRRLLLNDKGLRKKYTREELLTSDNPYLRKLGALDAQNT